MKFDAVVVGSGQGGNPLAYGLSDRDTRNGRMKNRIATVFGLLLFTSFQAFAQGMRYSFSSTSSPWYDVTGAAYGARGDGATDDTTAINAAISAAATAGGGTVFFPPNKTYKFGRLVFPYTGTAKGYVTLLIAGTLAPTQTIVINANNYALVGFSSMARPTAVFEPTAPILPGILNPVIQVTKTFATVLKNISIDNAAGTGILLGPGGTATLDNVQASAATSAPVGTAPLVIDSTILVRCRRSAFLANPSAAPSATISTIVGNGTTATVTTMGSHGFAVGHAVTITGNTQTGFNGSFGVLTVPTRTTFTIANSTNARGNDGTVKALWASIIFKTTSNQNGNHLFRDITLYNGGMQMIPNQAATFGQMHFDGIFMESFSSPLAIMDAGANPTSIFDITFKEIWNADSLAGGGSTVIAANHVLPNAVVTGIRLEDLSSYGGPLVTNTGGTIRNLYVSGTYSPSSPAIGQTAGSVSFQDSLISLKPTQGPVQVTALAPNETSRALPSGILNDFAIDPLSYTDGLIELHGAGGPFTLTGLRDVGGSNAHFAGRILTLFNNTGFTGTLNNLDARSNSNNQIITGTGANLNFASGVTVTLQYSITMKKWLVLRTP